MAAGGEKNSSLIFFRLHFLSLFLSFISLILPLTQQGLHRPPHPQYGSSYASLLSLLCWLSPWLLCRGDNLVEGWGCKALLREVELHIRDSAEDEDKEDLALKRSCQHKGMLYAGVPVCVCVCVDCLCGLVVRVPGCRHGGPEFDSLRYQIF
jgi:hypothetical protein